MIMLLNKRFKFFISGHVFSIVVTFEHNIIFLFLNIWKETAPAFKLNSHVAFTNQYTPTKFQTNHSRYVCLNCVQWDETLNPLQGEFNKKKGYHDCLIPSACMQATAGRKGRLASPLAAVTHRIGKQEDLVKWQSWALHVLSLNH